jgi:hypothetical protein
MVTEDVIYSSRRFGSIKISEKTLTDLATIPWYLRWAYSRSGKLKDAAIIHDAMLQSGLYTRLQCDQVLKDAMFDTGIHIFHVYVIYSGVRIYAKFKGLE